MSRLRVPLGHFGILVLFTAAFFAVPDGQSAIVLWANLGAFYWLVLTSTRTRRNVSTGRRASVVTIETLFLAFYFLIFYLSYQLAALGIFDATRSEFVANTFIEQSNRAITLSTIGAFAFCTGLRVLSDPPSRKTLDEAIDAPPQNRVTASFDSFERLVAIALAALLSVFLATGAVTADTGRYTGRQSSGIAAEGLALVITLFSMLAIGLLALRVAERRPRTVAGLFGAACAAYWCFASLVAGDRNTFLLVALVGLAGLAEYRWHVSRFSFILLLTIALLGYGAIEGVRNDGSYTADSLFASAGQTVEASGTLETSFNISTIGLRAALEAVPSQIDFGYGTYKLIGAGGVVPLVRGLVVREVDPPFTTTSDVLTQVMLPPDPGWSVGTSIIADLYIDWGWAGVPLGLLAVGVFAAFAQAWGHTAGNSWRRQLLFLVAVALIAELPRYSADFPIRILVWSAALLWANRSMRTRQKGRHPDALRT